MTNEEALKLLKTEYRFSNGDYIYQAYEKAIEALQKVISYELDNCISCYYAFETDRDCFHCRLTGEPITNTELCKNYKWR